MNQLMSTVQVESTCPKCDFRAFFPFLGEQSTTWWEHFHQMIVPIHNLFVLRCWHPLRNYGQCQFWSRTSFIVVNILWIDMQNVVNVIDSYPTQLDDLFFFGLFLNHPLFTIGMSKKKQYCAWKQNSFGFITVNSSNLLSSFWQLISF